MKEIIYKIKDVLSNVSAILTFTMSSIRRNLLLYIGILLVCSTVFTILLKRDGTIYTGDTKFILKEGSGATTAGGLGGVLGSIGLGGQGKENYERLIALIQTQKLQKDILLNRVEIGDSSQLLGDALIKYYELDGMLSSIGLTDFHFSDYVLIDKYDDPNLKKAVRKVGDLLTGTQSIEGLLGMSYDRKTHIISMAAASLNDDLTIAVLNSAYVSLERFFDENLVQNKSNEYMVLNSKIDSLRNVIRSKETQLARFVDQYNKVILNQDKITKSRLTVEIRMLYDVLGQLTTNAALLEYSLLTTPQGFVLLDEPIKPLYSGSRALWKVIVFSIFLGIFFGTLVVFIKQAFKNPESLDLLQNQNV